MIFQLKKNTIYVDQFKLKCSVGKGGIRIKNKEGDKITPKGIFSLGNIYYRFDRIGKIVSKLKKIKVFWNFNFGIKFYLYFYSLIISLSVFSFRNCTKL